MNRREVLNVAFATGTATAIGGTAVTPAIARRPEAKEKCKVIDTNVSLFKWPFRDLPLDTVDKLVAKQRSLGIGAAWAGSFEGLLHRDVAVVNQRLADACRNCTELIAMGCVNPTLPNWEMDLHACSTKHGMSAIRLHPNYHGYTLNDPRFAQLLQQATTERLFIQIAVSMEDIRTQHSSLRIADVDVAPLAELLTKIPGARVQLLNHKLRPAQLQQLGKCPGMFFDTARVDGTDGVPNLMKSVPSGRVLFGSHTPFLIPEAALIRVHESGMLDDAGLRAVYSDNAIRAMGKTIA